MIVKTSKRVKIGILVLLIKSQMCTKAKKIRMFVVTQPSLLKSTDTKIFLTRICKKS